VTITSWDIRRQGRSTLVTVVSDLVPGAGQVLLYHWYLDGEYVGKTQRAYRSFALTGDLRHQRLEVIDSVLDTFDPIASAPRGYPATRRVWWRRSTDPDVVDYDVILQKGALPEVRNATLLHQNRQWSHEYRTPVLDDLTEYTVTVKSKHRDGNLGAASTPWTEKVVRNPDPPIFTTTFNPGPTTVTIAAVP